MIKVFIMLPPIANLIVDKDTLNKHEITNHNAINLIVANKLYNNILMVMKIISRAGRNAM